jgi:recombinational DNA repair protein (RecF pathway)
MLEIVTDALVLDLEPSGEYNSRVFLYTEKLGGVVARATSLRKITSKMAAHLEPLTFSRVRLIQRSEDSGFQLGDALSYDEARAWRSSPEALREGLKLLSIFKESGFAGDADPASWNALWEIFSRPPMEPFSRYGQKILNILGYDYARALCGLCGAARPKIFSLKNLVFYCESCINAHNYLS